MAQGERKVQKTGRMRYLTIPGNRVLVVENPDGITPGYVSVAPLRDFAFALGIGAVCLEMTVGRGTLWEWIGAVTMQALGIGRPIG